MLTISGLRRFLWAILAMSQCTKAETIVSTLDLWDGNNSICCFASNQGAGTIGEVITTPITDSLLTSFTMVIGNNSSGPMPFRGYLAGWSGSSGMITGPILYTSPIEFSSTSSAFTAYTFNPNVMLIPGASYILFVANAETDYAAYPGNLGMGYLGTDIYHGLNAYSGGGLRFLPEGLPMSWWSTTPWLDPTAFPDSSANNDIPFSAAFRAAPEPANFVSSIIGITILSLIPVWKRHRQSTRAPTR